MFPEIRVSHIYVKTLICHLIQFIFSCHGLTISFLLLFIRVPYRKKLWVLFVIIAGGIKTKTTAGSRWKSQTNVLNQSQLSNRCPSKFMRRRLVTILKAITTITLITPIILTDKKWNASSPHWWGFIGVLEAEATIYRAVAAVLVADNIGSTEL